MLLILMLSVCLSVHAFLCMCAFLCLFVCVLVPVSGWVDELELT